MFFIRNNLSSYAFSYSTLLLAVKFLTTIINNKNYYENFKHFNY